ncbi:Rossman fold protein, TIGR00730 family [Amylibacter kogurei]|uniref:Cytokinin riboside 5'-monophosphate phosphoribohydrolase n=1 Tax=Paramylibacter kogurei TaxID=1889778 RepID=A0A2G5KAC3_9RHOB|nr:TIGR00730 family Rossman fold protein [Amylibacter kogurei]PIB26481.1 Rossman fold protein, TIGR00730 family [Amylibacter kogurei]
MARKQEAFPNAETDIEITSKIADTAQTRAPAYRLAFADDEFLCRDELRGMRMHLEMLKPEMVMAERGIESTVVMFGGARIPDPVNKDKARTETLSNLSKYYTEARKFARLVTAKSMESYGHHDVIVTGGGPGVMEAGNRGAAEAGGSSIALNIVLPFEQAPNEYCTPELCFNFHYFATRKIHFLIRAKAITAFPGGFGTFDELFEALTLIQTKRMKRVPILLFGEEFWRSVINWEVLADAGTIGADDLELFQFVETADQAMKILNEWDES